MQTSEREEGPSAYKSLKHLGKLKQVWEYKKKTLWPLFVDGVQLPQGYSHFKEAVYFLPLSSQKSWYSFYQPRKKYKTIKQ